MFFKRGLLAFVIVIGLLVPVGGAVQRMAWQQGYMAGQAAALGEEGAELPTPRGHWPLRPYTPHNWMSPWGIVLAMGAFLLLFSLTHAGRYRRWRKAMAHGGWGDVHGRWPHPPFSPWYEERRRTTERAAGKAEADEEQED